MGYNCKSKFAFTLAEVLITLGIIGVVSAITMPVLISAYRQNVVVEKLKKTSAMLQQAHYYRTEIDFVEKELCEKNNPDLALNCINKYYTPYIRIVKTEKKDKGSVAYLADGTGIYLRCLGKYSAYTFICLDKKACDNINEKQENSFIIDGKSVFGINVSGMISPVSSSRNATINLCKNGNGPTSCIELIQDAGWKIPSDYPHKF